MSCERYWREGIVLVEHGLDDPHREGCESCTRAHASRQELIEALPTIGAGDTGDPHWQAKVWRRLREQRPRGLRRWHWQLASALAAACFLVLWIGRDRTQIADVHPRIEIIKGGVAMRSLAAHVGDHLRVTVGETSDVWIYRVDRLALACRARTPSAGCAPSAHGMVVDWRLSVPGQHWVLVIEAAGALRPRGNLDEDLGALESADVSYEKHRVPVR